MAFTVDPNAGLFPEGMFLLEVDECSEKYSQKESQHDDGRWRGDRMLKLKLRDVYSGRSFFENWMMEGGGAGMGVRKMKALGIDVTQPIEAHILIGLRMVAQTKIQQREGYSPQTQTVKEWPESNPPPDWKKPDEPPPSEGTIPLRDAPLTPF